MNEPCIEFRRVSKSFGSQSVLVDIDLAIQRGLVTAIIGRSGIGKSVLLKHVVGLHVPDTGEVLYHGRTLSGMTRGERRRIKRRISYMFQHMALFDSMTVYANIALPLQEHDRMAKDDVHDRVMQKIRQLELEDIPEKFPSQISGGMQKRVALARALVTEPEIVLFDEPTTGLDPIRKNSVHKMISEYQQRFNFTAVLVSHDIPDVFGVAQRVAMLEAGRIVFDGSSDQIVHSSNELVQRFLNGQPLTGQAV